MDLDQEGDWDPSRYAEASAFDDDAEGGLSSPVYCTEPSSEPVSSIGDALVRCIPSNVRFHGKPLIDVLRTRAEEVRYQGYTADTGPAPLLSLCLSSSMLDADKLRRVWPLGGVFCLLQTLDLSGNLIHALEPSHLSGLTQLRELNLARNRLRSLRGIDVLSGSLVCLDVGGNLIESLSDRGVQRCRLLEALDLSGNNLRSPQELQGLGGLPHLTRLDLRVNPVSNAPSSRLFAVFHLRSVSLLDATPVTDAERQAAHARYGDLSMEVVQEAMRKQDEAAKKCLGAATASAEELRRENDRLRVELRVKSRLLHNATGSASQAREELMMLQDRMEGLCMGEGDTHIQRLPPSTTQATGPSPLALCASAPVRLLEGPTSEPHAPTALMPQAEATSPDRRPADASPLALLPPPPPPPLPSPPAPPTTALPSPFPQPIEVLVDVPPVVDVPQSEDGPSMDVLWASPIKARHPTPPSRLRHYTSEAGGGTEAPLASPADDWMLSTQVPSAEELDEAQADLRIQRQGLREQIHTKRSQLGRVRGCLSVLGQQLQEARREAGDDMDDESPAGSPLKSHARHRADHRGLQGRQAVLEEKRGAHRKLGGHMQVLEQRLTCLRAELSRRTAAFVAGVGTMDKGAGEAASGLPYEEALVELSKEVELTQDEVSKVAGQLCRLQSEMEALGGQLTGRVDHSYLAPSSPLKTTQARTGKTADPWGLSGTAPASPMLLRTSLSELEEGGGRLRRFAAEGSAEFILRLRQRLTAAKLLEDKVQTELDQLERELDQVGRILAQLQRQRLQQELALARQESRISQQQVRALLRALQQAQSSDDVEAVAAQQRQHEAHRRQHEAHQREQRRRDEDETQRRELQHTGLLRDENEDDELPQGGRTTAHVATSTGDEGQGEWAGEERGRGQGEGQLSPAPAGRAHAATATSPTLLHTGFSAVAAGEAQRGHRGGMAATAPEQRRPAPLDTATHSAAAAREECGPAVGGGNGGGPLDLSPRSCYMHLRALQQQLDEARDREEMVHETGIAVDRRSRTPLGRLEVTVVRTGGWRLGGGRPQGEGVGGGPYYLTITMDPITSCFGRTGAFGSHPAGSYLFRTSSQREERHASRGPSSATTGGSGGHGGSVTWNDKFVVKPVLSKQALLKLVLMDEAPTRAGRRRDVAVGEAFVPLVSLLDQRPHLFWLPLTPPEQTTGSKRKHPSSSNPSLHHTATPQHDASQSSSTAVCSLRVRVRFEYSRASLLEDRLEQIAHTVQARGYDLHEVEREVLEEDAFRHAMGQPDMSSHDMSSHMSSHMSSRMGPPQALSPIPHHNTSAFFAHDTPLPPPPLPPHRRLTPRKAAADRYTGPPVAKAMRGPGGHKAPTALASSLLSTTSSSFLATHRSTATPSPTPHATTAGDTDAEPPFHAGPDPASSPSPPAPASPPRPPSRPLSVDGRSPCVLSSLYSSLSHLQSVAHSAKLASSTPQRRLPSPALTRPHAGECFDADSPYHPRPVLQPSPARAPSPMMPSYLVRRAAAAAARREDENTPATANGRRFARLADTRGRTPPPPPDVLSEGGSRELSLHDPRLMMDPTSHWPQGKPANLAIFKDPAVRRQPNTRDLDKSTNSLIPGRLIGIDTRETRWRQEMCKRFASTT